jgi:hypothetical protein
MTTAPTWNIIASHVGPRHTEKVSSISFHLSYEGRQCQIDIALPQPIGGQTPETKAAMHEFQHLHDALGRILAEHKL